MSKVLIIDNHDSFTYNLVELFRVIGVKQVDVCFLESIHSVNLSNYSGIVLSPGPGLPKERINFNACIQSVIELGIPLLGVCLGHQAIVEFLGGKLKPLNRIIHGEASRITFKPDVIFNNLAQNFLVGRYHSWVVDAEELPDNLQIIASTSDDLIMAVRHKELNVVGVQFHPESILTECGNEILNNWFVFCVEDKRKNII